MASKVTSRTWAVMAVHIYGLPMDMDPLVGLCRDKGLLLIEDAAEAIGQTYRGRPCGSFGDISIFSFYANKHVAMGRLGEQGIGSRPFFWPMHEQPVLKEMGLFQGESYPVAGRIARRGFYIPSGIAITDVQINRVAEVARDVIG